MKNSIFLVIGDFLFDLAWGAAYFLIKYQKSAMHPPQLEVKVYENLPGSASFCKSGEEAETKLEGNVHRGDSHLPDSLWPIFLFPLGVRHDPNGPAEADG